MTEKTYDYYGASGVIDQVENYIFDGTYILLAEDGANLLSRSKPLAFLATGKFWVNNHAHILRPWHRGDLAFFVRLLESIDYSMFVSGAAQPKLTKENLGQQKLAVPPWPEQQRIAAYLDASCAAIDAAVVAKRRQLEALDAVRESLIETAVTLGTNARVKTSSLDADWIGPLPAHWTACRIKRVISRMDYGISVSSEPEGIFPVLKMGNIQSGEVVFSKIEFVNEVEEELLLHKDDLLYNRTNSPDQVGKAALFRGSKDDRVTFASYLVRLRANHRIMPEFLNYVVNCQGFLAFARKLAIPSVQQSNLNSTRYGRMFIPLPPLSEQRAICEHLDAKLRDLKSMVTSIETQIATLTAYRKSLIHECVTGQRRISEADVARARAGHPATAH